MTRVNRQSNSKRIEESVDGCTGKTRNETSKKRRKANAHHTHTWKAIDQSIITIHEQKKTLAKQRTRRSQNQRQQTTETNDNS